MTLNSISTANTTILLLRNIDCANDYDNEHVIGEALKELFAEGVVKREELFIQVRNWTTTIPSELDLIFPQAKLWNTNHRPEHVRPDLMATLADLGLTYLDSFVIHWPMAVPSAGEKAAVRPDGCYPAHKSKV